MARRRIWLTRWEWACCGDPFSVGDTVTLSVIEGPIDEWLMSVLGPPLATTIDHVEAHHEVDDGEISDLPTVTGTVRGIEGVSLRYTERRIPRERPAPPALELGNGMTARTRASDHYIEATPIPGSATSAPLCRIPWPPREGEPEDDPAASRGGDGFSGYLVELDVV